MGLRETGWFGFNNVSTYQLNPYDDLQWRAPDDAFRLYGMFGDYSADIGGQRGDKAGKSYILQGQDGIYDPESNGAVSVIPNNAWITGIKVWINTSSGYEYNSYFDFIQLVGVDGAPLGSAKGGFSMWPWEFGSSGWTNYFGGYGDTWGASLTPYIVKHQNFGVRLGCSITSDTAVASVHIVIMKIYYVPIPNVLCNVVTNI